MFAIVMIVVLLLAALVTFQLRAKVPYAKAAAAAAALLALVVLALSCVTQVPTRELGVVTAFGRPTRTMPNGLHLKAPWEKVNTLDGAWQTDEWAVGVRIGNGSTADIPASVRWRIKLSAGVNLYQGYRQMDNIRNSLVERSMVSVLNSTFYNYDPLTQIQTKDDDSTPDIDSYSAAVKAAIDKAVGNEVEIDSVVLRPMKFNKSTQDKINLYQAEVANTRIAQQRELTAEAQARANNNLAASVSKDPNVLVSRCLDTFEDMVKAGQSIPIGFSCWPNSSTTTVVPSSTK